MPELPFSHLGVLTAINLATLWLVLETFGFRPFDPRPPWRTPRMEFVMWLLLGLDTVLLAINVSAWLFFTFNQGT